MELTGENSAHQNQRESPFLRLPAELRNKIYGYVLGGKDYKSPFWQAFESSQDELLRDKESLSLLSVCRQIYKETSILPFQLNTFQFEHQSDLSAWIKTLLPGQRDAIRALKYFTYIRYMLFIRPYYAYSTERFVGLEEFPSLERVHAYYTKKRGDSDDIAARNDTVEKLIKESLANVDIKVVFESPDG